MRNRSLLVKNKNHSLQGRLNAGKQVYRVRNDSCGSVPFGKRGTNLDGVMIDNLHLLAGGVLGHLQRVAIPTEKHGWEEAIN